MTKNTFFASLVFMGLSGPALQAELLVYEGFDYEVDLADEVAGALDGKDGGVGFSGPWENMTSGSNNGIPFVFGAPGNTNGTNGDLPDWDGEMDNLPQSGGYVGLSPFSNDQTEDRINARRALGQSAGSMAGEDGVLWMSMAVHFEDNRFFFAPGLALTDGGGFEERVQFLSEDSNGLGVGNGGPPINDGRNATDVTASAYVDGIRDETTKTDITDLSTATADYVIVLKYEFGDESDSLSVWAFAEDEGLNEGDFDENAGTLVTSIDEDSLTTLAVGLTRAGNAYDEIRIGSTFGDVVTGLPSSPSNTFPLTIAPAVDPETGFDLEWESRDGKLYNLRTSTDLAEPVAAWTLVEGDIEASPPMNVVNVQGDGSRRFYAVEEFDAPPPPPVFTEDFEEVTGPNPPEGWVAADNGTATFWEVGEPSDVPTGPDAAANGLQCAGTNIGAAYAGDADASLVTPAIAVPEGGAVLEFAQYIDTETSPSDDLGSIRLLAAADDSLIAELATDIQGISEEWTEESIELPEAANGIDVKIEFRFISDGADHWAGFYIDDVSVNPN